MKQLASLIGELYVHWPSIQCPSDNGVSLWRDAWTNYGVCSGLSEKDYFNNTLLLRKKINMLSVLKWKGNSYPIQSFILTIQFGLAHLWMMKFL